MALGKLVYLANVLEIGFRIQSLLLSAEKIGSQSNNIIGQHVINAIHQKWRS